MMLAYYKEEVEQFRKITEVQAWGLDDGHSHKLVEILGSWGDTTF